MVGSLRLPFGRRGVPQADVTIAPSAPLPPGTPAEPTLQAGPYRLERQIGNGGESHVWLASHTSHGTPAVVKVQRSDVYRDRMRRETAVLHALLEVKTPSVVRLLPAGQDGTVRSEPGTLRNSAGEELLYCVLEPLPSDDRWNLVRQGPMKRGDVIEVCFALRAALRVMHLDFQILHNDLKPDNIVAWRERSDGRLSVRLLDFGQAALLMPNPRATLPCLTPEPALRYVYLYGSFPYMPPERWHGQTVYDAPRHPEEWVPDAVVDERADQWAYAASVFELLTGYPLVTAASGPRFREDCRRAITSGSYRSALRDTKLPARARPILERALALRPADRYAPAPSVSSLDFLCRDLETALA